MSCHESIQYLYNLREHGIKFGLDNISRLVSELGNPHKLFHTLHVGGTNGKGSTSAIAASILQAAGFNVGLFTSPHLISFTERIRINGAEITERDVVGLAEEVRDVASRIDDFSPTFFEVVTAMALLYFSRQKIDIAVMEVGMGGRLDATNIISPDVCVITQISYDHMEFLGKTLREIAQEKAGIIKKGIPVVTAHQEPEAMDVIKTKAKKNDAELYTYESDFSSVPGSEDTSGIHFDYHDAHIRIDDLYLPLAGVHQMQNASVAIKAVSLISQPMTDRFIKEGLEKTKWPGRLECIHHDPPVLIDGAHNPAAAAVLSQALQNIFLKTYKRIILILGIMGDKDIAGILKPLLPLASDSILTRPSYTRAASPETLARIAESMGYSNVHTAHTVKDALEMGMKDARNFQLGSALIVVTGSFYTIGEAKEVLGQTGILTTLRE
ncbi:MAG TPA: folylpolyglutamate synthase/dihydrofolate synthase family protein [Thermodesulfovibrionales bacterium]|jgi:dihydrofolate synthase/folylpolyglutamate synthase|nr:folylpolyglutamate synthase/dihydrofolate synthase family protein [Thermodesulfovibrionales bacterium]